eukprot:gene16686-18380_t
MTSKLTSLHLVFIALLLLFKYLTFIDSASLYRREEDVIGKDLLRSIGIVNKPEKKVIAPKYVMNWYRLLVDENGDRKRGMRTNADKIRCFFPNGPEKQDDANELNLNINAIGKDEIIIRAELQVFQIRNSQTVHRNDKQRIMRVDIKDGESGNIEAVRLLYSHQSGWKSFQLTETVKKWQKDQITSNKLQISIRSISNGNESIRFASIESKERSPYLVVFSQSKQMRSKVADMQVDGRDFEERRLSQRSTRNKRGHHNYPSPSHSCKRKSMVVEMSKIGWDRYILAPLRFDAYQCVGKCRLYHSKAVEKQTDHSVLQAMLSKLGIKVNGQLVQPPCCAPSKFESKTLLVHRKNNGQSVIAMEEFFDIVVKSCACL